MNTVESLGENFITHTTLVYRQNSQKLLFVALRWFLREAHKLNFFSKANVCKSAARLK